MENTHEDILWFLKSLFAWGEKWFNVFTKTQCICWYLKINVIHSLIFKKINVLVMNEIKYCHEISHSQISPFIMIAILSEAHT